MTNPPRITGAGGATNAPANPPNDQQPAPPQNPTTVLPARTSSAPGGNRSATAANLGQARPQDQQPAQTFPFTDLPAEVQVMVVENMPTPSLVAMSETSRAMRDLTRINRVHARLSARVQDAYGLAEFRAILRDGGRTQHGVGNSFRSLTQSLQAQLLMQLRDQVMYLRSVTNRTTAVRELIAIVDHLRGRPDPDTGTQRRSDLAPVDAALRADEARMASMDREMTAFFIWATRAAPPATLPGTQPTPARVYSHGSATTMIGALNTFAAWLHNRGQSLEEVVTASTSRNVVENLALQCAREMPWASQSALSSHLYAYQLFKGRPEGT